MCIIIWDVIVHQFIGKSLIPLDTCIFLSRILVASDIHLGYGEKMAERAMDSFNSFDELLTIGKERNVDLCILGKKLSPNDHVIDAKKQKMKAVSLICFYGPKANLFLCLCKVR